MRACRRPGPLEPGTNVSGNNVEIGGGAVRPERFRNLGSQQAVWATELGRPGRTRPGLHGPAPTVIDNGLGGVVGIYLANYNTPINLSLVGSGTWFLGSELGGTYTASSLGHGSGNLYRLGGGGADLYPLAGRRPTGTSGVLVGRLQ